MGWVHNAPDARPQRWLLATAAGVLAVSGCSAGGADPAPAGQDAGTTKAAGVTRTAPARVNRPPAPPPRTRACYRLSVDQAERPTNASEPVPCRRPHTAQTYHVGVIPKSIFDGEPVDAAAIADYVTPRCDNRFVTHIGGSPDARVLSRLQPVWFVPTRSQLDRGARWFRCDVVGVAASDALARLPATTAGMLDDTGSLDRYGLCSTAVPNRPADHQVMCGRTHSWRAFAIVRLDTSRSRWPSSTRLAAARQDCKAQARARQGYPLRWTYGWQRPTRAQWQEGRHWGYCWAPER